MMRPTQGEREMKDERKVGCEVFERERELVSFASG